MSDGFLYVLINPTMPGLVKVGKTTRDPSNRVAELSSATGVPSPFILAFQQPVANCDFAETWVHNELARKGHRHASNREFFNAPLHEIVQVVVLAATLLPPDSDTTLNIDESESNSDNLAEQLCELAKQFAEGTSQILKNPKKSIELYEQAAALNNIAACIHVGTSYYFGLGIPKDYERALNYYNMAIRLGNWQTERYVAELFFDAGQVAASQEHWNTYFENVYEDVIKNSDAFDINLKKYRVALYGSACARYFEFVLTKNIQECVSDKIILAIANYTHIYIEEEILSLAESDDKESAGYMKMGLESVRRHLNFIQETNM